MSKPVAYSVLIRNGQTRRFEEIWVTLYRELLWGPDAFVAWLEAGEEAEYEPEELSGVAIVDFDSQTLQWGEQEVESLPVVQIAKRKLLQQAWPGFEITYLSHGQMYKVVRNVARLDGSAAVHSDDKAENDDRAPAISIGGLDDDFEDDSPTGNDAANKPDDDNQDDNPLGYRPQTVREAAGQADNDEASEDDEDGEDDEQDDVDDPDFPGAWITIIDQNGKVRQRRMRELSKDLLTGVRTSVQDLAQLQAAEVPPEKSVTEGFWINVKDKQIGIWGGHVTLGCLDTLQKSWPKWKVDWAVNGYRDQCSVSGVPGMPMSDSEVLAKFIPQVLSAKKMDFGEMFNAVGGSLRKTAMKATGCLVIVLSLPILIGGLFFGKLKEAGYAVGTLVLIVVIAFKFIEFRLKGKFKKGPFNQLNTVSENRPPVAGPLNPQERQRELDKLLKACGFPTVSELQPHFPENPLAGLM